MMKDLKWDDCPQLNSYLDSEKACHRDKINNYIQILLAALVREPWEIILSLSGGWKLKKSEGNENKKD